MGSISVQTPNRPTREVVDNLAVFADILAACGPDSREARDYCETHAIEPGFRENAAQLYRLEQEDYQDRIAARRLDSSYLT
jgi:hypothetical protein